MKFTVILEPDSRGGYSVICPAIPGCVSEDDLLDEALVDIREAIALQLESGQPVPVVVDHLAHALLALAHHRGVDYDRLRLPEKLQALTQRIAGDANQIRAASTPRRRPRRHQRSR